MNFLHLALRWGSQSRPEKRDILHFLPSLWSCRHCYCCSCCLQTILLHRAFVVLSLLSLCARLSRDGDATIEIQRGEQLREFWSRYPNVTKRVKPAKNHAPIFWLLFLSFLILSIVNFDLDGGTLMNEFWHSFKNKTILTKVAKCLKLECLKKSAFF